MLYILKMEIKLTNSKSWNTPLTQFAIDLIMNPLTWHFNFNFTMSILIWSELLNMRINYNLKYMFFSFTFEFLANSQKNKLDFVLNIQIANFLGRDGESNNNKYFQFIYFYKTSILKSYKKTQLIKIPYLINLKIEKHAGLASWLTQQMMVKLRRMALSFHWTLQIYTQINQQPTTTQYPSTPQNRKLQNWCVWE